MKRLICDGGEVVACMTLLVRIASSLVLPDFADRHKNLGDRSKIFKQTQNGEKIGRNTHALWGQDEVMGNGYRRTLTTPQVILIIRVKWRVPARQSHVCKAGKGKTQITKQTKKNFTHKLLPQSKVDGLIRTRSGVSSSLVASISSIVASSSRKAVSVK